MTTRSRLRVFHFADYESTTISKKALCQLQDREAQECGICRKGELRIAKNDNAEPAPRFPFRGL